MTREEWMQFAEDFRKRFPSESTWLKSRQDTRNLWWAEVFSHVELHDALEVSKGIMLGTIVGWDRFERIAATYRIECGKRSSKRRDQEHEFRQRSYETPLSEKLSDIKTREVRYRCLECEDTGFASIWHPDTIKQARRAATESGHVVEWKTVAVRCKCRKGDNVAHRREVRLGDRQWHIPVRVADSKAKAAMWEPQ